MKKDEVFLKKIGQKIRQLRHEKDISIEKLAHIVDTSFSQIARIERGEINTSIQTLKNIVDGLNINLSEFFTEPDGHHAN